MSEYVVRINRADALPRCCAQRTFMASDSRAAERMAEAWAYGMYGGHPENYDASAMLLSDWNLGRRFVEASAWQ